MTIKQKFSSIDQSKLTADQKAFLTKIKDVTKNFTDSEMNKKVEAPLNGFIEKAKEKMPEAIKSAPSKRTSTSKSSQTRKPKRTAMSLAKEIRKEGESWNDARARASKMMKEDSKDLSKTVETELDKLSKLVKSDVNRKKLAGISGTDIKRDAVRKAKPRGARTVTQSGETSNQYGTFNNKLGRKYYESRDRHSDRLAPNYPKNAPLLENGAYLTDPNFGGFQNQVYAGGGLFESKRLKSALIRDRKNVNHSEDYEVRYSKPKPNRSGYNSKRNFACGGSVVYDLAGHTGGSLGTDTGILSGTTGTGYTGLVGETGAMSSGEMFNKGGAIRNERKHVNKDEDYEVRYAKPRPSRTGYKGKRSFEGGGGLDTPRIYVADLEAYNSGRLNGEWLDLTDYNDSDELMDAIQNLLNTWGVEEYAIHDVEYVPSSMYSEYMGKRDFEELYEMMDLAKENDLPLEVVQDVVSQYSANAIEDFVGKYDSAIDFAEQLVDDMGIESFNDFQYYLDISETDRRLLSQEMADSYVEDIIGEDGGNRIIEEAGLNVDEYEDASEETKEEMIDLARSMVYDENYDTMYEALNDPYNYFVEEQGMYDAESFAKANFVRVDYDKLAEALEQDYTMISYDGDVYVFNIR